MVLTVYVGACGWSSVTPRFLRHLFGHLAVSLDLHVHRLEWVPRRRPDHDRRQQPWLDLLKTLLFGGREIGTESHGAGAGRAAGRGSTWTSIDT
ncbi:hypothetical protein EVAR_77544_1 [Eumeta japonica]|uniref:Uncharacterized protein n=1 Tax=Eumeta variegata TaxID=151549 RepID=A0A4C1T9N2_EUMVA|nr:hypothetical protein EVAR_77544_1 [Eumeta japonica]